MTSVAQAAMAASVMVGLVSVPAVSETALPEKSAQSGISDVSGQETGREVVKSVSPDGFHAEISTAFQEFVANVNSGETNATLETPTSDLQMEKTSEGVKWKLSTARGSLEIRSTHDKVVEVTETPQGTLTVKQEDGVTTRKFRGANRTAVEQSRARLKQMLEDKKKELDSKRKILEKDYNVKAKLNDTLVAGSSEDGEHALVINRDSETVDLQGWTLEEVDEGNITIPSMELEPGERLRLYSGTESQLGEEENALYDVTSAWASSDEIRLYNKRGDLVDQSSA